MFPVGEWNPGSTVFADAEPQTASDTAQRAAATRLMWRPITANGT